MGIVSSGAGCRRSGALAAAGVAALLLLAPQSDARAADRIEAEIGCLALTIYYEARGEPEAGKRAVGYVVMNRARSDDFPTDVCDVVQQGGEVRHRCQFSWWCDGLSDRPRDKQALRHSLSLAQSIYHGCVPDPTAGALWFHATRVKPAWSKTSGPGKRIGRHVFYRGAPGIQAASADVRWRSAPRQAASTACALPSKPPRNLVASSSS